MFLLSIMTINYYKVINIIHIHIYIHFFVRLFCLINSKTLFMLYSTKIKI